MIAMRAVFGVATQSPVTIDAQSVKALRGILGEHFAADQGPVIR